MEPGTGLTILGAAVGSAKLVEKILGPTAEYLSEGLRDWTQKSTENVGRIFQKAKRKLGGRIEEEGSVPPRVLKDVLQEGAFCEDEITSEYFAGVLASSRTGSWRDDRGAVFSSLLARLSGYQLRAHYLIYRAVHELYRGESTSPLLQSDAPKIELYYPGTAFIADMGFGPEEIRRFNAISSHIITGLTRENLIRDQIWFGPTEFMRKQFPGAPDDFWAFSAQPSPFGVELFNWAHGKGDLSPAEFLKYEYTGFDADEVVTLRGGLRAADLRKGEV